MLTTSYLKATLSIAASGTPAASVLNHFANRLTDRRVDNVSHLVRVSGAPRRAVIQVMQQLQANGFGRFVCGRKGHESRFVWSEA